MWVLLGGALSTQFPLDWLQLCRLLPYSDTNVVLPWEEGEEALKVYPFFLGGFAAKLRGGAPLPLQPDTTVGLHQCYPIPYQEEGSQMEEGLGFHPTLKWFQSINQARAQLEYDLAQEAQVITKNVWWSTDQVGQEVWETESTDSQRSRCYLSGGLFSGWAQPTQLSCYPGVSPLQFPSATWAKCWPPLPCNRKRMSPATITVPEAEWLHRLLTPEDSPAHQTGTPPLPIPSFYGYPHCWHSPCLAAHLLVIQFQCLYRKNRTTPLVALLGINTTSRPMSTPKRLKVRSKYSPTQGDGRHTQIGTGV